MVEIISRVFLILVGGTMLVGGGFCAVSNAALWLLDFYDLRVLLFLLFATSLAVAGGGVLVLRTAGAGKLLKHFRKGEASQTRGPDAR